MERDAALLAETRPTAINLRWALDRMLTRLRNTASSGRVAAAYAEAAAIADEDAAQNEAIGRHGLPLIQEKAANIGLIPITPPSVAETSAYIRSEQGKWDSLVEKLGLKGSQ